MGKILILCGLILMSLGLLWPFFKKMGLGELPGDFYIKREGFSFYFPLATCLLISLGVSALIWFIQWLKK